MQVDLLMKQTCANRVGPCSISLFCLSGKTKGHNWATVFLRVSIGDNLYLPVKGRSLQQQREVNKKKMTVGRLQKLCMISSHYYLFKQIEMANINVGCDVPT